MTAAGGPDQTFVPITFPDTYRNRPRFRSIRPSIPGQCSSRGGTLPQRRLRATSRVFGISVEISRQCKQYFGCFGFVNHFGSPELPAPLFGQPIRQVGGPAMTVLDLSGSADGKTLLRALMCFLFWHTSTERSGFKWFFNIEPTRAP